MREIPGMVIINPSDDVEAKAAVRAAYEYVGPVYLRFGRLAVPVINDNPEYKFEIGKGVEQNLYNFLIKYAMKQLEQGISKERIIKNIDNAIFNTTYSNVVVFEGGKAIESFEMIDLRNEIVEEIQNKNVKIKEERD